MKNTLKEFAFKYIVKIINSLDNGSLTMEYLDQNSKVKYNEARKLLYEILKDNNFEISNSGRLKQK